MRHLNDISGESDEALQHLYAIGNGRALTALIDRYGKFMLTYATGILDDQMEAEEVVQDVLLKMSNLMLTEQIQSVPSWLKTWVKRKSIDLLRKRRRIEYTLFMPIEQTDHDPVKSEKLSALYERYFMSALDTFSKPKQFVMISRILKNETNKQVAEKLGVTQKEAKNLFDAGIITVRRRMLIMINK